MHKKKIYIFAVLALLLFFAMDSYAQCAMCKAAAESDLENNTRSVAGGLNKGILFLMAIPYLVVGVIFRNELVVFFSGMKDNVKVNRSAGVSVSMSKEKRHRMIYALTLSTLAIIVFLLIYSYMS